MKKNLVLHVYLSDCFADKGVFNFWDKSTLRFFYSIGTAQGSACSSTATAVDVKVSAYIIGLQKFSLVQFDGKKTNVEYEGYMDTNQEYQIRGLKVLTGQK